MYFTGEIFALQFVVIKTQNTFSLHEGFLAYATNHHRETIKSWLDTLCYMSVMKQRK